MFSANCGRSTRGRIFWDCKDYTALPYAFECSEITKTGDALELEFNNKNEMLLVTVSYIPVEKANGFIITTKIKNFGKESKTITHLSSANLCGIGKDGLLKWNDKRKMSMSYFQSTWQGEAQYRKDNLEQLGLYRNSVHPNASSVKINSQGSWSTGKYIP